MFNSRRIRPSKYYWIPFFKWICYHGTKYSWRYLWGVLRCEDGWQQNHDYEQLKRYLTFLSSICQDLYNKYGVDRNYYIKLIISLWIAWMQISLHAKYFVTFRNNDFWGRHTTVYKHWKNNMLTCRCRLCTLLQSNPQK